MRRFLAGLGVLLLLVFWGCGSEKSVSTKQQTEAPDPSLFFATIADPPGKPGLKIVPPDRPPPDEMLVRDLRRGSGRTAHHGDRVDVYYKGVDYKTGRVAVHAWPPARPLTVQQLGLEGWGEGWEEGIEGMKEGGRRELVIPKRLTGQGLSLDYVIELVRVQPSAAG